MFEYIVKVKILVAQQVLYPWSNLQQLVDLGAIGDRVLIILVSELRLSNIDLISILFLLFDISLS